MSIIFSMITIIILVIYLINMWTDSYLYYKFLYHFTTYHITLICKQANYILKFTNGDYNKLNQKYFNRLKNNSNHYYNIINHTINILTKYFKNQNYTINDFNKFFNRNEFLVKLENTEDSDNIILTEESIKKSLRIYFTFITYQLTDKYITYNYLIGDETNHESNN